MRFLPLLLALLLVGCAEPRPETDPPTHPTPEPSPEPSPEPTPDGYDPEAELARSEARDAAREACAEPLDAWHDGNAGFLTRAEGDPDDAVARIEEHVGAERVYNAQDSWKVDGLSVSWQYNASALQVGGSREEGWDLARVEDAVSHLVTGEREEDRGVIEFVTRWTDGDRTVTHVDLFLQQHGNHTFGILYGTPVQDDRIGLDAAWEATRAYGECIEAHDGPWDWNAWADGPAAQVATHGHGGALHYNMEFVDAPTYGGTYRVHVDAVTGETHTW